MQIGWERFESNGKGQFPRLGVNGDAISDILKNGGRPTKFVRIEPLQFHFHSLAEHAVDGCYVRPRSEAASVRAVPACAVEL